MQRTFWKKDILLLIKKKKKEEEIGFPERRSTDLRVENWQRDCKQRLVINGNELHWKKVPSGIQQT